MFTFSTPFLTRTVLGASVLGCLVLASGTGQAAMLDPASQAGLVPHKALYEVRMTSKKSGLKVANITGKMVYQWQPSCDAWVSKHQFDMLYEYVEMPATRLTSDYATYESFDGSSYSFSSQRKNDQILFEEVRGNVEGDAQGRATQAVFSVPPNVHYSLPEETLFPMAHTLDVLKNINTGTRFYKATLFDGSDTDGPVTVNSFIGKKKDYVITDKENTQINSELITDAFYPLRLAFFSLSEPAAQSDYEMSIDFHKNGVISAIEVDYKDFSLRQDLVALEPMASLCEEQKNAIDAQD